MSKKYIIAYDCGTTAMKTVLIDMEGSVIGDAGADNPLIQPHASWAEVEPEYLWKNVCTTTTQVMLENNVRPEDVAGLAFVAHWKNIIPVDKSGNILYNSIIWMDARANDQAKRLNESAGFFVGTGQEYWPRLMWLKEEKPEIWNKADKIMGLNTYFKWKATGNFITEPSDDFIHSYNEEMQQKYTHIIKSAGLEEDLEKFPPIAPAIEQAGSLTSDAARQMGLVEGIPVFGGFGDLVAITVGTGCCKENSVHIYMGTSSWFVQLLKGQKENYSPQWFTFDDRYEGALFALQTGCMAFDWAVNQLYHAERQSMGSRVYDLVNKDVEDIEPGSEGLIATHWLTGELPPLAKNAKGMFINLTSSHDRRHMIRAMMESICYTHRNYITKYEKETGEKLKSIRVVGGGTVSDVWMQMMADILQIRVEVPESPKYTGAVGAYYSVMVGLGELENYDAIYDAVVIDRCFEPRKEYRTVYDKMFDVYTKLYPALKDVYDELNGQY